MIATAPAAAAQASDLGLGVGAQALLRERYLARDDAGRVVESPRDMMERVARAVAAAEDEYAPGASRRWAEEFREALCSLDMLPSSPVLMNAGTGIGFLSACVVLPVEDTLDSIFTALHDMALVHQSGGGTGFSFSRLRPRGDVVRTTHGVAGGPVSFLRLFDAATDAVRQGGRRRGAGMAVLSVSHPDIEDMLRAKWTPGRLENVALSVAVDDAFMHAVHRGDDHALVNPRNGAVVRRVDARTLFALIAESAHRCGDPGMLFLDRIARDNPLPSSGRIEAVNPCGEVPLLPGESCTLGSVNLARMVDGNAVDWAHLRATVRLMVRFLDDVVSVNRHPLLALERAALRTRKIGVGVMGLAEMMLRLGIPYASNEAVGLGGRLARAVREEADRESERLAQERGAFPAWAESVMARDGRAPRRNAQVTSVAPTGSISMIAGTTAGIEPLFAVAYARRALGGSMVETNATLRPALEQRVVADRDAILATAMERGTLHGDSRVPADLQRLFATALEIAPSWHLRMQQAFQRHVDAAVSKTVNLSADALAVDVEQVFQRAWSGGSKGIAVYRYGSRPGQVLRLLGGSGDGGGATPGVEVDIDYAGGCAAAVCEAQ